MTGIDSWTRNGSAIWDDINHNNINNVYRYSRGNQCSYLKICIQQTKQLSLNLPGYIKSCVQKHVFTPKAIHPGLQEHNRYKIEMAYAIKGVILLVLAVVMRFHVRAGGDKFYDDRCVLIKMERA
jgi:hypothetical protein